MGSVLVGRTREREAIAGALHALTEGRGMAVALEGEPGIGKSRLLAELVERAAATGCAVVGARASEFEADLPYAIWTEALDRHLADVGERRVSRLGLADAEALVHALPALGAVAAAPPVGDRHRTYRALRDLLERLAGARPLVLWLDDLHWADPASVDALAALVHRPPAAAVLLAIAAREGQVPAALAVALACARREERLTALRLGPLSEAEAIELVGERGPAVYSQTGGNPFYLEQLARVDSSPTHAPPVGDDGTVPPAVAAALAAELSAVTRDARRLLDAAGVAGDPFEPRLAAVVAELPEPVALEALDELLSRALVRPAGAGQFAFRHPVVRHAIYVATPHGWRLGAHARAAAELERRGATVVQRAHHVEHAAQPGDERAIALLEQAATKLMAPAPATAAGFHAAALRLLPAGDERGGGLRRALADAQAAAGDAGAARDTLLGALESAGSGERLALIVAVANQDWWLGGHQEARRRLEVALAELPAQPDPDRIQLRLALSLTSLMAGDLADCGAHADDALADALALGDPAFEVAALAIDALALASAADAAAARRRLAESAASLDRLTASQLQTRLPALWMNGRARRALGEHAAALADLERGAAIARQTGRERVLLMTTAETVEVLIELGRIADAVTAADECVERARLAGNPRILLWAQCALASACLAAGDVAAATRHAGEAEQLGIRPDFHAAGQPGWSLGAVLTAAGNAAAAVPLLRSALVQVLPADRPAAAADLIEALLATDDVAGAEAVAGSGDLARSAVLLALGESDAALVAARAAGSAGGPLAAARARLAEGRALAAMGERAAAVEALRAAESALDAFGAVRRRDEAVRELRRLGHRVLRAARGDGDGPLTAREHEIAALVGAGRTNREVAEQLVLSQRTIEAHLRNVYGKLGVRSRVELVRALHGADEPPV